MDRKSAVLCRICVAGRGPEFEWGGHMRRDSQAWADVTVAAQWAGRIRAGMDAPPTRCGPCLEHLSTE